MKLAKLSKVELREVWAHEAHSFTKWLSDPENLELLSDEVGIGIELVQAEANVGRYNVDILAREENTSKKIIIENQLETTNHSHLGQIITYAAGLEAEYIIWLVREAREEHQQAVDWLNEHTDDKLNFFLVVVELWQIGASDAAVKFSVVSRPNDWKKTVMEASADAGQSETKSLQFEFWQKLHEFGTRTFPELKFRQPRAQNWFNIAIGRSDCHVTLTVYLDEDKVGCELYMRDSKELFAQFFQRKDEVEKNLGLEGRLDWQELPGRKASRIRTFAAFDLDDEKDWDKAFQWLGQTAILFRKVFSRNWNQSGTSA
jgi:hypothetical protein